ncbi:PAS-domain containing protein [Sphingobium sp. H39-3-25]|uniref:sensor histidine kinase n=1 Tax=Sphingobium arseniciresistens TaxID=3030834 RepID=UPI0023B8FEB7|nr:PAS-domain containing protein [Sphingobium arseniciresistens]
MLGLSTTAMMTIGGVLALWFAGALWAVYSGLRMREAGLSARNMSDRLGSLLQSAPALPVMIRPDGRLEGGERLASWIGRDRPLSFASELTARDGELQPEDAETLARDIAAAQRAGKSFSRPVKAMGSERTLMIRGAPASPDLAAAGSVILWVFDATESQAEITGLQEEREQLRGAIESLSGLIEAAPLPMWHRRPDLRLALVNSAYVKAVDAESALAVIKQGVELVEAVGGQSPMAAAARAAESGEPLSRLVPATIDGVRRVMRVVDVPLGSAGIAGFAIDMHELEQARAENRRMAAAQRDMLDRLSAGVAQFGADRTLRFWNHPFMSLFALQPEHLSEEPEFERVLDRMREAGRMPEHRDFPAWRSERRDWFLLAEAQEENWLMADGTHLRVFAQPLPDGGLLMIFEDRTEQVQLSSARDTLLRVRTATFDNLFEAIGVFSSDGRLHLWNSRFRTIWQVDEDMLATHPRIDVLMQKVAQRLVKPHQASIVRELVRAATIERKQRGGRVAFADGTSFDFAAIPLPDGNALFTMLDVTDSRRMEQVLRDRNEALEEADRIKTAFLTNISYDLRTPLTSIAGFAEMMQNGYAGALPPTAAEYVDAITQSTDKLAVLIDNMLDLAQGQAGSLELELAPVDLAALARESADRIAGEAKERGLELAVDLKPSLGGMTGDGRRITQALDKLLANAVRTLPTGARILLHGDGNQKMARLIVSDDGPGVILDARPDRGETLDLGLPLARQLVEAHGGTLSIMSEPGEGTLVTMELPRG